MLFELTNGDPVIVQGITGRMGQKHATLMKRYGTRIVGGTGTARPGQEGAFPTFATCGEAVEATRAVASIALVPPDGALAAVRDAVGAGLKLVVTVAEGIPVHDALRIRAMTREAGTTWVGASTPGICIPSQRVKLGFLPDVSLAAGAVGVMSKSGTLSYEVCRRLVARGLGQSRWIGVGGDPVKGMRFADLAAGFAADPLTRQVLLIGEIGGDEEEEFARVWQRLGAPKPAFALIAGAQAKEGVPMGHAGALILGSQGSLASKRAALLDAGVQVFSALADLEVAIDAARLAG